MGLGQAKKEQGRFGISGHGRVDTGGEAWGWESRYIYLYIP
jgi:hypothetical protein